MERTFYVFTRSVIFIVRDLTVPGPQGRFSCNVLNWNVLFLCSWPKTSSGGINQKTEMDSRLANTVPAAPAWSAHMG